MSKIYIRALINKLSEDDLIAYIQKTEFIQASECIDQAVMSSPNLTKKAASVLVEMYPEWVIRRFPNLLSKKEIISVLQYTKEYIDHSEKEIKQCLEVMVGWDGVRDD